MDLIGGYLLVMLILFSVNISLLVGNFKMGTLRVVILSAISFIVTFMLMYVSSYLNFNLLDYFSYLFLIIAISLFAIMLLCIKKDNLRISLYLVLIISIVSTVLLSCQSNLGLFDMVLYSLCVFISLFVVYQLSKLLHHAKRQYPIIIGEYMCLFSVLMFIFALTYNSARALDYSAFSPFLILTPTYQLIYVIIAVIVILIGGVLVNDNKGGNS